MATRASDTECLPFITSIWHGHSTWFVYDPLLGCCFGRILPLRLPGLNMQWPRNYLITATSDRSVFDTQSTMKFALGRNTRRQIINWSPVYCLWHAPFTLTEDWGNAAEWAWKGKIGKPEFLAEDEVCKALVWPIASLQAFDRSGFSTEGTLISASAAP